MGLTFLAFFIPNRQTAGAFDHTSRHRGIENIRFVRTVIIDKYSRHRRRGRGRGRHTAPQVIAPTKTLLRRRG